MQLLSLACGNGVTCHTQIVSWGSEGDLEVWHQMPGDEFGPGQCVPGFRIESFLGQVLSSWSAWPEKKQSEARLAIIYINLSASGYLDTRMFQIMQGWEMLSNAWGHKVLLSGAEKNLKADIKSVYRQWRANHPKADPKGYLGSRLTSLFQWPPARRQMEALADSRGIDMARLGLYFERLKKARDKIAHSGKMPKDMLDKKNESLKLLKSAQYGLQLLLLAELGYSGLVVMEDKGWQSFVKIGEVLKSR
ncbi:MAG: hypothetical protein JRJ45_08290 [Deltaproteobacteria bacterium]|nr:hypothetical protein [Deltaproteobacteria bacterium]